MTTATTLDSRRPSPWLVSALAHGGVLLAIGALAAAERWRAQSAPAALPFEVIEAPRPALSPARPLQPEAAPPPPKARPRAVFGAGRDARRSNDGPQVKAGNTTAKAEDQEKLREDDARALPIPADEFLVTRMPELAADLRVPYPEEAKRKGVQGAVVFDLLIDAQGTVRQAAFIEGPGAGLNEAAAEAVRRLKFRPALIEDRPVAVRIRYAYRFVLER